VTAPRALDPILKPTSIAVVGASRHAGTIGHQIVANLVRHGFSGPVYPVNRAARSINAMHAWPSVSALPEPVDVAVIAVPSAHVCDVAEECAALGVRGLVVISSGFRELGAEGAQRERALLAIARRHGIRMIGPNCMGVINSDASVSMNATFAPVMPDFGPAAFVSQSGALGVNVLDYAKELGIGIAQFVSMGNKADVSGNDLLLHWEDDPAIGVILMYVENFGNARNFLALAPRVARKKPIIVLKAGRSAVGARAASSHTGALSGSDAASEALLTQAGVLRAGSIEELFDMAVAFTARRARRIPASRRVGVVGNSGGPGVLAADALEMAGLRVVDFAPPTVERLRPLFPAEASLRNPLDMIASATPAGYRASLDAILDDDGIDSAVAIFTPPLGVRAPDVAEAIGGVAAGHPEKPVLAVLMGRDGLAEAKAELSRAGVPSYVFPESAARALDALARYGEILARPARVVPVLAEERARAAPIVARAVNAADARLDELEALALVQAYGIPTVESEFASDAEEAVRCAERIGYPVVLKIVSPEVSHKSDVGGVRVGLGDAAAVRVAFAEIFDRVGARVPGTELRGVLVQRMARGEERELIAGVSRIDGFGPMVMVGLGGIYVEALRDVQLRLAPVDRCEAREMLRSLRSAALLGPFRGAPAVDVDAVADAIVRLGCLADAFPEIAAIDVNPLRVGADGALALAARVLLRAASPGT
jgi:acetyl coenzyme A synthetase (ADP forming)-like protein